MKTSTIFSRFLLVFLTISSGFLFAGPAAKLPAAKGAEVTVKGEVLDLACFLDHGARGDKHKSCAQTCINGGQPMGLITKDGTVYLLLGSHDDMSAYDELKKHAAATVTVTGEAKKSSGMTALQVNKVAY